MQTPKPLAKKHVFAQFWVCIKQAKAARNTEKRHVAALNVRTLLTQTGFFWDGLFTARCRIFLKLGFNLDSLSKHALALVWGKSLSQTQQVLDKWIVERLVKKQTEAVFALFLPAQGKDKRTALGLFKLFWLSGAIIVGVFIFI